MPKWNRTQVSHSSASVEAATAAFRRMVEALPGEDRREVKARRKARREQRELLKRQARALRRAKTAHQGRVTRNFRALVNELPAEQLVAENTSTALRGSGKETRKGRLAKETRKGRLKVSPQPGGVRGLAALWDGDFGPSPEEALAETRRPWVCRDDRCGMPSDGYFLRDEYFLRKEGAAGDLFQQTLFRLCRGYWAPDHRWYDLIGKIFGEAWHDRSFTYEELFASRPELVVQAHREALNGGSCMAFLAFGGDTPRYRRYLEQSLKALRSWRLEESVPTRSGWENLPVLHPESAESVDEGNMIRVFDRLGYIPVRRPAFVVADEAFDPGAHEDHAQYLRSCISNLPKAIALVDAEGVAYDRRDDVSYHVVTAALAIVRFAGDRAREVVNLVAGEAHLTRSDWHQKVNRVGNLLYGAAPEAFPVFWRSRNGANMTKALKVVTMWGAVKAKGLTAKNSLEELYAAAMSRLDETAFQREACRWQADDSVVIRWETRWAERCPEEQRSIQAFAPLEEGGLRVEVLPVDDPRGLFLGDHVTCCQRPGDAAESSAWHGATHKDGRFLVVTSRNGITAQGWVWRGKECLVIDNIEAAGGAASRVPSLMPLIKQAVSQWGVPVRMGMGFVVDLDEALYPPCKDIEPSPSDCYSDAKYRQVWVVRPEEVVAPTTEIKTTDGLEVSPMVEGEQDDLHAIAAQLYPEGWQFADLDGVVLVLRDGGLPVGYACLNPEERRVDDIAVLPTARRGVKALTESAFQVMGHHTWTAEARETTSLPMLRRMAQRGRIRLVEGDVSHYVGNDACYEVEITPL